MRKTGYKYGVVVVTNDKNWVENLGGLTGGIYIVIELPPELDAKIVGNNWLDSWLDSCKSALRKKLWAKQK